jgi:DNA-binding NarL/FixJ family response regulator
MRIQVSIADDHPLIIVGIEKLLQQEEKISIQGTFSNGSTLLEGLKHQQPDVLLLDIYMPDINGYELAGIISKTYPQVRIMALTNSEDIDSVKQMLNRGATGYILKTAAGATLINAIKTLHAEGRYLDPAMNERLLQFSLGGGRQDAEPLKLTRRELEILQLIASNYTSREIADKLFLSKRTVDNHRFSLLAKLDVKNAPALIRKAIELNLIK